MNIEAIKRVCGKDRFAEPYLCDIGGEKWVGACNGYGIVAVRTSDLETLAAASGKGPNQPEAVLPALTQGERVSLSALRAWCNVEAHTKPCPDCNGTKRAKCSECKGTGRIEHDCDCPHCHIDDEGPCDECGGEKEYDCEECDDGNVTVMVPGVIAGAVFDRVLLAKVLASAPSETLMMLRDDDRLNFEAPGWRGALMRLHDSPEGVSVFRGEST